MGSRFTQESCTASDGQRENGTGKKDRPGRLVPHPCETSALPPSTRPPRSVGGGAYSVSVGAAARRRRLVSRSSVALTLRRWTRGMAEWRINREPEPAQSHGRGA